MSLRALVLLLCFLAATPAWAVHIVRAENDPEGCYPIVIIAAGGGDPLPFDVSSPWATINYNRPGALAVWPDVLKWNACGEDICGGYGPSSCFGPNFGDLCDGDSFGIVAGMSHAYACVILQYFEEKRSLVYHTPPVILTLRTWPAQPETGGFLDVQWQAKQGRDDLSGRTSVVVMVTSAARQDGSTGDLGVPERVFGPFIPGYARSLRIYAVVNGCGCKSKDQTLDVPVTLRPRRPGDPPEKEGEDFLPDDRFNRTCIVPQ